MNDQDMETQMSNYGEAITANQPNGDGSSILPYVDNPPPPIAATMHPHEYNNVQITNTCVVYSTTDSEYYGHVFLGHGLGWFPANEYLDSHHAHAHGFYKLLQYLKRNAHTGVPNSCYPTFAICKAKPSDPEIGKASYWIDAIVIGHDNTRKSACYGVQFAPHTSYGYADEKAKNVLLT